MNPYTHISVEAIEELGPTGVDLCLSCHGYESRSTAHLTLDSLASADRRVSFGFDFPQVEADSDVAARISDARKRLTAAGFSTPIADDRAFERTVKEELQSLEKRRRCRLAVDISSMSRSRIAAALVACCTEEWPKGCDLDIVYFPGSYASHKHPYEPLEYFGPAHRHISGWPDDPDLPLALLIGLGTEPGRADGVVELLEPDILATFIPIGPEEQYIEEVRKENRRVLEVGGQPVMYDLQDPIAIYGSLLASATRLAGRARLVVLPLGPKVFFAISVIAALKVGPQVGVWKASAGRGVQPVDVKSERSPILVRLRIG